MPVFQPFVGVRYASGTDLNAVCAPPYDVVDEPEQQMFEARDPRNAIRLILPRDVAHAGDRYEGAAHVYRQWCAEGTLAADATARFYGYRMEYAGPDGKPRHTLGVFGALALPERAGDGDILPHERTMAKAKSDRLDLLRATRLNLDPIWGLSLAQGLSALVDTSVELGRCVDEDGNTHTLFAIDDPEQVAAIGARVASAPVVLADGHHRFETAITYRAERVAAGGAKDVAAGGAKDVAAGGAPDVGSGAIMALIVELADDELCIQAIHRLVALPDGFDPRAALGDVGTITAVESIAAAGERGLVLADGDGLWLVEPHADVLDAALAGEPDAVSATDAAIVEHVIAPRWPDAQWTFRHDGDEVVAQVKAGTYSAGVVLRAVSVATTRAAATARVRMPQKTTFFYPKPRTGMVFRDLDGA